MSLSRAEAEQLRALASAMQAFASSATAVAGFAVILEAFVQDRSSGGRRIVVEQHQCSLFGSEAVESDDAPVESAPERTERDEGSRTCAVESAPSSSADLDLPNKQKKTARIRPFTDDPLPDDFRDAYHRVVAERGVKLPSAEYLWAKFVDHLWANDITYATRFNLKRKWRDSWCWHEKPIVDESAPPASSEARPVAKAEEDPEARSRRTERAVQEQRAREQAEHEKALPGIRAGCAKVLDAFGPRAPPEPRSASA